MTTLSLSGRALIFGCIVTSGLAGATRVQASGRDDGTNYYNSASASRQIVASESHDRYAFSPTRVSVATGTKLVWKNKSDTEHNVTITSLQVNKDFKHEQSVSVTFTKAGTYHYHCEYHPYMKGTIVVK